MYYKSREEQISELKGLLKIIVVVALAILLRWTTTH